MNRVRTSLIAILCFITGLQTVFAESAYTQVISVVSPDYCSDVKGETTIKLLAPGFEKLSVKTWNQNGHFGTPVKVADVSLDADGIGSFVFKADEYTHGPLTMTISGDSGKMQDNCYLQLYNQGGVKADASLPADPPAANGLKLLFTDDFDGPLSIGKDADSKYYDHKPPNGSEDFSSIPFVSHEKPNTPFAQMDTYLRIRADAKNKSAGLISSAKSDGSGFKASVPAYFECRFIGPNAIGSWPAF